jgi:hypothetical protein
MTQVKDLIEKERYLLEKPWTVIRSFSQSHCSKFLLVVLGFHTHSTKSDEVQSTIIHFWRTRMKLHFVADLYEYPDMKSFPPYYSFSQCSFCPSFCVVCVDLLFLPLSLSLFRMYSVSEVCYVCIVISLFPLDYATKKYYPPLLFNDLDLTSSNLVPMNARY